MCYHYCFYATDRQPNPSANAISSVPLFCILLKFANHDQSLLLVHVCQLCLSVFLPLYGKL